jgi:hypothetical protein
MKIVILVNFFQTVFLQFIILFSDSSPRQSNAGLGRFKLPRSGKSCLAAPMPGESRRYSTN